jgi:hypothetical protein
MISISVLFIKDDREESTRVKGKEKKRGTENLQMSAEVLRSGRILKKRAGK